MFKPTSPLFKARRRLQLTTKQVGGGYYKGNRTGSMGDHTKWGGYVIDWRKVRTYVVPERLDNFKLTPFVTKKMEPTKTGWYERFSDQKAGRLTGQKYINLVKAQNPEELEDLAGRYQEEQAQTRTTEAAEKAQAREFERERRKNEKLSEAKESFLERRVEQMKSRQAA